MKSFYKTKLAILFIAIVSCFFGKSLAATEPAIDDDDDPVISYTDAGAGKPLVLIHAFPTDKQLWEPQQEELKKHFRVITLDLWGFGKSSPVEIREVSMTNYADEVKQLLDQLHIDQAIIGGESMGGYVALAFLEKYPNNTTGLILSDTQSIADSEEMQAQREINADDVLENGSATLIQKFIPNALSPNALPETREFLRAMLAAQQPEPIAYSLRGMALRNDTSAILANTSLPILILTGDHDTLISPEQSQNMHALAKNSQLVTITNAGHLSNLEQPKQWNEAVIAMFDSKKSS